jgi:hypothetical protein
MQLPIKGSSMGPNLRTQGVRVVPQWLLNLVTGLALAVATSILTVRLSLRRFHAERWWEHKVDAYTRILYALSDLIHYAELLSQEELGAKFAEGHRKRLEEKHTEAYHELRRATTVGSYIVSDEVATNLDDLEKRRASIDWDGPPWEGYDESAKSYAVAISEIRAAAKTDLKVP